MLEIFSHIAAAISCITKEKDGVALLIKEPPLTSFTTMYKKI